MEVIVLSIFVIGVVMSVMSIGVIFSGRCLRGSCGGGALVGPDGEDLTCSTCPHRKDHEQ